MARSRNDLNLELPTVTVIGAGIAGLTAAHELAERGFGVQVVESRASDFEEYACKVGGLAANQFTRVRSPILDLHGWLRNDSANLTRVETFRGTYLKSTAKRFPLLQRIRFDKQVHWADGQRDAPEGDGEVPSYDELERTYYEPKDDIPDDWWCYWDRHGVYNSTKIVEVLKTIHCASRYYMDLYFPRLANLLKYGPQPNNEQWLNGTLTPLKWSHPVEHAIRRAKAFAAREGFVVKIIGYTDTDGIAEQNRAIANQWVCWVRDALIELNRSLPPEDQVWELECRLETVVVGGANPTYDQATPLGRNLSNRVEFAIVEQVIPGEHGFRFFPAFYRNLFDTMRRTPVFDDGGDQDGTAFDQLVPPPRSSVALSRGQDPQDADIRRFTSFLQIHEILKLLCDGLDLTLQDLFGLEFYMLRFLMSCGERRATDTESVSLLTYIGGENPSARFSEAAVAFLNSAPRALAAMSATESDARTQLDVTAQLLQLNLFASAESDMTLNGPTTAAWLDHWKTYLKNQGVKFFVGKIASLNEVNRHYVPVWTSERGDLALPIPEDPENRFQQPSQDGSNLELHRYVLALSYQAASDLLWSAYDGVVAAESPFRQIIQFDEQCGRRKPGCSRPIPPKRDPSTGKEISPSYPLRTISGAQFFFSENYRFGQGDIYYSRAAWGLTSISQFAYWRNQIDPVGEFLGQLTVDIASWHVYADRAAAVQAKDDHGNTAWYSSLPEIGQGVWTQINAGFEKEYAAVVQRPRYFHLDHNLVFSEELETGYVGSAVLRIARPRALSPEIVPHAVDFDTKFDPDSGLRKPLGRRAPPVGGEMLIQAPGFADVINAIWSDVFAVALSQRDVMVSPRALGRGFLITFRQDSESLFYIAVNDEPPRPFRRRDYPSLLDALRDNLPGNVRVEPLDPQNQIFAVASQEDFELAVANVDGAIEILNGPRLIARMLSTTVRLLTPALAPSGRTTIGAIRCNAVVSVPKFQRPVYYPFEVGRIYRLGVAVGSDRPSVSVVAYGTTPQEVRDVLYENLIDKADRLVIAQKLGDVAIVISPIASLDEALIRILGPSTGLSTKPFILQIGDERIEVAGGWPSVSELRDAIVSQVEALASNIVSAEPVGDDSLQLTSLLVSPRLKRRPIAIAVLNVDRQIEVVGAPALTVEVTNLRFEQPSEGFVVLRNDAEFLINVPGQWSARPGLLREPDAIPRRYRKLTGDFGDKDPEIYYGVSADCTRFEYWVPAGTYMATYTRITTMEAANESGRHAAAAIIYKLLSSSQKRPTGQPFGLVANFPYIWRIEDHEPPDLRFYKELDSALFAKAMPHVLDILGITDLVNAVLESTVADKTFLAPVLRAVRRTFENPGHQSLASLKSALAALGLGMGRSA